MCPFSIIASFIYKLSPVIHGYHSMVTSTIHGYVYHPQFRLPSMVASTIHGYHSMVTSTIHGYVYHPRLCLPSMVTSTISWLSLHGYVYHPWLRLPSMVMSTIHGYVHRPWLHLPSMVIISVTMVHNILPFESYVEYFKINLLLSRSCIIFR